MKATTLLMHVLVLSLFNITNLHAMRRMSSVCSGSATSWPPLLWASQQPVKSFAQTLKQHTITVEQHIQSQLSHARANLMKSLLETTQLTDHDMKIIPATIETIKAIDVQRSVDQVMRIDQQVIRTEIPQIELITNDCDYKVPIEVLYDEYTPFDIYPRREISFTAIDESLILSRPDKGTFQIPQLYLGKRFWECNTLERIGALLRTIAGHMMLEHHIELTLFDQVLAKRGTPPDVKLAIIMKLAIHQALEADLMPASKDKECAIAIKAHVERESALFSTVPNGKERIRNLEWIIELFQAMEPSLNLNYKNRKS